MRRNRVSAYRRIAFAKPAPMASSPSTAETTILPVQKPESAMNYAGTRIFSAFGSPESGGPVTVELKRGVHERLAAALG